MVISADESAADDAGHHAWEHALCMHCDQKIGRWEDERERFLSSVERPTKRFEEQNYIEAVGFNQEYIALACMADLYRCNVFADNLYREVNLGEKHSKRIADILNNGHLSNFMEYPIVVQRYNDQSKIIDEAFQIPHKIKFEDGVIAYWTVAPRGWSWIVKVDNRPCELLERVALGSSRNIKIINLGSISDRRNKATLSKFVKAAWRIINS